MAATVIHLATVTDKEDAEKKRAGLGASIALDAVLGIAAAVMAFKAHACESRPKQIGIACLALVLPQLYLIQVALRAEAEACG